MYKQKEKVDNSNNRIATCDKISEQIKTVQWKPKVRTEDTELTAHGRRPVKTAHKAERNQEDMVGIIEQIIKVAGCSRCWYQYFQW